MFEPFTSNTYIRRVLAGEFVVVNKHLVRKLEALDLWTDSMREAIIAADGSVQHIDTIPAQVRAVYKTAFELPMKKICLLYTSPSPRD